MPTMDRTFSFPLSRRPLAAVDATSIQGVRAWMVQTAEGQLRATGRVAPRFCYLTATLEESFACGEPRPGEEAAHALRFHLLGEREEVIRRFRAGERHVEVNEKPVRIAAVLEHRPGVGEDGWWLAWREIPPPGDEPTPSWQVAEGQGRNTLPPWAQVWLRPSLRSATSAPAPRRADILYARCDIPRPVPQHPERAADR